MSKFDKVLETVAFGVERSISFISYPVVKTLDWIAVGWLRNQIDEREKFVEFLEDAHAAQREALNEYLRQNKALSIRLASYEKNGETVTFKHRDWLNGEVSRLTVIVRELAERNESLNNDNAKLLVAGNAVAELLSVNKPKSRLTKKDKEIKSIISQWNEAAVQWK
jgi:hypothetical protein